MIENKRNQTTDTFAKNELVRYRRGGIACLMSLAIVLASWAPVARGQSPALSQNEPVTLTLDQAVEFALSHYPAVKGVLAQAAASHSGVDLARTAYLPSTDLVWQANRATRNNVFGLFFPQPIPLPISGPVLGTNNGTNV